MIGVNRDLRDDRIVCQKGNTALVLLPVWLPIFGLVKLGEWLIDLCTPEPRSRPTEEPENPCGESMSLRKLLPANG